jgi:hypothetical protein
LAFVLGLAWGTADIAQGRAIEPSQLAALADADAPAPVLGRDKLQQFEQLAARRTSAGGPAGFSIKEV